MTMGGVMSKSTPGTVSVPVHLSLDLSDGAAYTKDLNVRLPDAPAYVPDAPVTVNSSGPISAGRLNRMQVFPGLDSSSVPLPATSMTAVLGRWT